MELLTEKYRPKKIEDLVIINKEFGMKLRDWKTKGVIDSHLLFYGPAGTGKSSTISVILNELDITDYMITNGSDKTSIEDTRRIIEYASVPTLDDKPKVVIFEEFERLSPQAQDSLKYVLEKYSEWCRFIFTTNNINKVTTPIISRCQTFNFQKIDTEQFVLKIVSILNNEKISYNQNDITDYIQTDYPDLRKCINDINKNIVLLDGVYTLTPFHKEDRLSSLETLKPLLDYIQGKTDCGTLQKYLATKFNEDDIEYIYKVLYNHLDVITPNQGYWEFILVKIAEYLFKHPTVAFKDLNLMSCLVEIKLLMK